MLENYTYFILSSFPKSSENIMGLNELYREIGYFNYNKIVTPLRRDRSLTIKVSVLSQRGFISRYFESRYFETSEPPLNELTHYVHIFNKTNSVIFGFICIKVKCSKVGISLA